MPSIHVYNWKLFFKVHDYCPFGLLSWISELKTVFSKIFGYVIDYSKFSIQICLITWQLSLFDVLFNPSNWSVIELVSVSLMSCHYYWLIDRSAIIQKDYVILHTIIMQAFKRKQTAGKFKASCEEKKKRKKKIATSF